MTSPARPSIAALLSAVSIDFLVGSYLAVMLYRIIWLQVLVEQSSQTFSGIEAAIYGLSGLFWLVISQSTGASLGRMASGQEVRSGWRRAFVAHVGWLLICLSIVAGWVITKVSPADFFSSKGLEAAGRIFGELANPEWKILGPALLAIVETIYLALISTLFALPASFVLAFLSARNVMRGNAVTMAAYTILRVISNFARSIEPLIWAIIFSVWVGIGPFAGMLALMVHTIASLTKQYSEAVEDVDRGPVEAIEATGASPILVVWYAVVPQVLIPFLSFTIYRWDINVRMATVIGLVGGGGIGTMLMQYQGLALWREVGLIVLLIALVVWVLDYVSARVREALQ